MAPRVLLKFHEKVTISSYVTGSQRYGSSKKRERSYGGTIATGTTTIALTTLAATRATALVL
ncbi:hypothetical protein, partial [Bilophila wadsworthia]|uniref:hypothetical protein n=1 Tax=Bilophila wadsworthia TaxID=35833 RepID=UPI003AB7912B